MTTETKRPRAAVHRRGADSTLNLGRENAMIATLVLCLFLLLAFVLPVDAATINATGCTRDLVAAAVTQAVDGDTVTIPAGTCSWTTNLTVDKAITIQGAGIGQTTLVQAA